MGFIPQISCRHCGKKFSGIYNRCPHCGARRVKQSGRAPASTTAVRSGTAAAARANSNTQVQFYFGCALIALVIIAVIILISTSLGAANDKMDISGTVTWNDAAGGVRPESITVNLLAGGQKVSSVAVYAGEDGTWSYVFKDVPVCDEEGVEISYSVSANAITDYEGRSIGYNLTMNYVEPVKPTPTPTPTPNVTSISTLFLGSTIEEFTMHIGDAPIDLDAQIYPVETVAEVIWRSTDENICTVDSDGKVTAVGPGWAEIIAECGPVAKSVKVLVLE